jgi:hypothetical protein
MTDQQTPQVNQPTSETDEEKKLRHELEEERLKNQIHKLRASSIEIWVKEIKSIALLAIFIVGTATNGIIYLLELMGKKVPREAMHHVHRALASAGAGTGGGGTGDGQVAMAMAQPSGFDLTALINGMGGAHTLWQILLFAILIPIGIDWLKKQKRNKEEAKSNASTRPDNNDK